MVDLPTLNDADFERFLALIYRVSGIRIPATKRVLVSNRVRRRLKSTGIADFNAYYTFLTSPSGTDEMPRFLDAITTNETYFFRDQHQFEWFGKTFLTEMLELAQAHRRPKSLRIWSAAASNGSELYSLALILQERKAALHDWSISLLGTDLSEAALQEAREATYDARDLRLVEADRRRRYFHEDPKSQRWTLNAEIRALPKWQVHNLMRPLATREKFDCIFLKNVLIYFDAESKQIVARHMIECLAPRGYLVLGPTEMIPQMLEPLERRQPWLYQKAE
jgi:chemotaxis protein methyltransferase CheR